MEIPQSNKNKTILIVVLVLLIVLGLSVLFRQEAFRQYDPRTLIENKINKIQEDGVRQQPEAPAVVSGVQFASYPDDFPKDLMIFPANFEQSLRYKNPQGVEVVSITYIVPNGLQATIDMFKTLLTQAKWTIDQEPADKVMLLTVSKEKMRAEVTIEPVEKDASKVHLLYYFPK
ncbi:MAG: hypothetical protein M1333_02705 [Patescibacteria group bacterium]|nr:hypothetical protein [Patescibacteria group bacterium]